MPADYLHGVETIEILAGATKVREAKTAVIGLIGTAPIHHVAVGDRRINVNVLSLNDVADARYFGADIPGYTIPRALRQIRAENASVVVVINVFDPAVHKTTVAAADLPFTNAQIQLLHGDVTAITVKVGGGAGAALVEGTDYSIDRVAGLITALDGGALDGDANANVAYSYGNPAAVDGDDIVGTVVDGVRTGMQAWREAFSLFGFYPKLLDAPGYSQTETVVAAMRTLAAKMRAIALVNAPVATTVPDAIEGRGPSGSINFNVSDPRVQLLYPHVKRGAALLPYSSTMAGVIAATDAELGFWYSPSNRPINGITGVELALTASLNDPDCDTNQLNAVGIATVFNAFGTGYRTWGNRSSAYPASTDILAFIVGRRVADQVHESLELAMLPFIDRPITPALISAVLDTANAYIRTLIGRGALPQGSRCEFLAAKNPPEEIAAGHLTFSLTGHPTPPAERITFESFMVDTSLLASLAA